MKFKRIKEEINDLQILDNENNLNSKGKYLLKELEQALRICRVGISKRETINNFLEIANKIVKNTTVYDTNKTSTDLGELTQYIVDNYEIKKK